jgi:hypothetical protein
VAGKKKGTAKVKQRIRSQRARLDSIAETQRLKTIAELLRIGKKDREISASLRGPGEEVVIPEWIYAEVATAEAEATPGELPLALFRIKERPIGDALVVMRLSVLQAHFDVGVRRTDSPAGEEGEVDG